MLLPSAFYPHADCLARHLPHLRPTQVQGQALWVGATILARSGCQNAVLGALLTLGLGGHTTRQYLREWLRDGADRAAPCQVQLEVESCFAPLLRWVLAWWEGSELTLAVAPTAKGGALVVSVVYRGLAMPVRVLCDRGLQSPDLWVAIRRQGWHPYMPYNRHMTFQAATGPRGPAWRFVAREGLPRTQASLHPERALGSRLGNPLGHPHGRSPREFGSWCLRHAGLDRTGLPDAQAHGLAVAPDPAHRSRPRRPARAGPGHPLGAGPRHTRGRSAPPRPGPRSGATTAPGAGGGPPSAPEPVSVELISGPAVAAPRLRLGAGLATAPAGTGSARRTAVGGPALQVAPSSHKDADGSFTYPYQGARGPAGAPKSARGGRDGGFRGPQHQFRAPLAWAMASKTHFSAAC